MLLCNCAFLAMAAIQFEQCGTMLESGWRGPDYDPVYLQISTDRDNPIALTSEPASDMNFYNPRYSLHLTI